MSCHRNGNDSEHLQRRAYAPAWLFRALRQGLSPSPNDGERFLREITRPNRINKQATQYLRNDDRSAVRRPSRNGKVAGPRAEEVKLAVGKAD
jgi:hypothetical protein